MMPLRTFVAAVLALITLLTVGCAKRDVQVTGNQQLSDSELIAIARRPLQTWREEGHRPADLHDAAYAMERAMEDVGLPAAEVGFAVTTTTPPEVTFTITEGPQVHIGSVTFHGGEAIQRGDLLPFFLISPQLNDPPTPFVEANIWSACRLIERRYRIEGYLKVLVEEPRIRIEADRAHLDIHIDQGRQYHVVACTLVEAQKAHEPVLLTVIGDMALDGKVYHAFLRSELAARMRRSLRALGHLEASVTVSETIDHHDGSVRLVVDLIPGPQFVLAALETRGNQRTRTSFLRRRLQHLSVGSIINGDLLDQGIQTLYQTGLFRQVTARTEAIADAGDDRVRLVVAVDEAPTRRLELSTGYGSYEQLRGALGWVDDNLFGVGLRWTVGGQASMKGWGGGTGLLDRHHFGPGRSLGIDLRSDLREEPSFIRIETSVSTSFRHEFRPDFDANARWSWTTGYSLSLNSNDNVEAVISGEEDASYRLSTIQLGILRDTRQKKTMDPEAGTIVSLNARWSADGLGSQIPYVENRARWTHHRRLHHRLVAVVNLNGITRDPSESDSLPIGERVFLGGATTVRSFGQDELGPKDADGNPLGGLTSAYANAELRWRPWRSAPNLEIAAFYDVGGVSEKSWNLHRPFGHAIGGGLRYIFPVGPARLDAGYNPGETFGTDDRYAIHLTVGFAF